MYYFIIWHVFEHFFSVIVAKSKPLRKKYMRESRELEYEFLLFVDDVFFHSQFSEES